MVQTLPVVTRSPAGAGQRALDAEPRRPQAHVAAPVEPAPPVGPQHVAAGVADAVGDDHHGAAAAAAADQRGEVGRSGVGPADQQEGVTAAVDDQGAVVGLRVEPE